MLEIAGGIILAMLALPLVFFLLTSARFWGILAFLGTFAFGLLTLHSLAHGSEIVLLVAPLFLVCFLVLLLCISVVRRNPWHH